MALAAVAATAACSQLTGLSDLDTSGCDDCSGGGGVTQDGAVAAHDGGNAVVSPPGTEAGTSDANAGGADTSVPDTGAPDTGVPDTSGGVDANPGPCPGTAGPTAVRVGAFCIDSTEITNDEYATFLAASPALSLAPSPACAGNTTYVPSSGWPANTSKKTYPVVYVDWCDAYAYCAWSGKRLCGAIAGGPSAKATVADKNVDQWYAACSTAGASVYPYGGNAYVAGKCNDTETGNNGTRAVASYAGCQGGYAGIFDMNGNAYEWEDACDVSAGASDPCLIRGGSWAFPGNMYGGCNTYFSDYVVKRSDSFNDTGFRCCSK